MSDSTSRAFALINDRLENLQALMTDEPIGVVTERYRTWKGATSVALVDMFVESVVRRFDSVRGPVALGDLRRRPTPPTYLHAAASRDFLTALKRDLEADPVAVLRLPLSEPVSSHRPNGIARILDLLERRLRKAFRVRPEKERDVQEGFETLLAGAEIAYERENDSIVYSSKTYVSDFTFPGLQTALELKLCNRSDREKEIIVEINDDILAYRTKYPQIIFGIYDLGFIRDMDRFSEAFEAQDGVLIRVIKH